MTLAESRKTKKMVIQGVLGNEIDLTELWFKIHFCEKIRLGGVDSCYQISFKGDFDKGLYVLGQVVEAIRQAHTRCRLEVSCIYE